MSKSKMPLRETAQGSRIHTIDMTESVAPPRRKSFLHEMVDDVRKVFGLSLGIQSPDIDVEVIHDEEKRVHFTDEMSLKCDQHVASSLFRITRITKELDPEGALIVPLVTDISEPDHYNFFFWIKSRTKWQAIPACCKDGVIRGRLEPMDIFCAVAEVIVEVHTVSPFGSTFVSQKDERIQLVFQENAVKENTEFHFQAELFDQKRLQEYKARQLGDCIIGATNILTVTVSTQLQLPAQLSLPLDIDEPDDTDDSKVVFLHYHSNMDGDTVVDVIEDCISVDNRCYTTDVMNFCSFATGRVSRSASTDAISEAALRLRGDIDICNIITFINYEPDEKLYRLLVDCVDVTRLDGAVGVHEAGGMVEVKHSRSRDIQLKNKAKISIDHDLSVVNSKRNNIYVFQYCTSQNNHVTIPFQIDDMGGVNIRFSWGGYDHRVYFRVNKKTLERFCSSDPTVVRRTPVRQPRGKAVHGRASKVLTEKSMDALGKSLPMSEWHGIGLQLSLNHDGMLALLDGHKNICTPGFLILKDWFQKNGTKSEEQLLNELTSALEEVGRVDIAEVVTNVRRENREIRRSDFDGRYQPREDSVCTDDSTAEEVGQDETGASSSQTFEVTRKMSQDSFDSGVSEDGPLSRPQIEDHICDLPSRRASTGVVRSKSTSFIFPVDLQ
ncbi:uncharacterized protein LOC124137884 [Haliotis rufescens]|uniref:uncharacterized protein LOC124137884 n=1 Tax=Haliotis rufescens TaxID=6454 RepID=UPI00201F37B3|nr:uncharacterized protein LOC124137884 [Haliotis rufescens]